MCSVQEEGETQLPRKKGPVGRKCMKCEENAVAIARMKDPFCKSCFNAYVTHRFRATIGKSRLIRDGEKALLAFSGGISSRVLLALVEEGLSMRVHKKLRFIPTVIYIDEGAVLGLDWSERCKNTSDIISVAMEIGLPVCFTQLEQIFFDSCTAYPLDDLLKHCPSNRGASCTSESRRTLNQTDMSVECKQASQERVNTKVSSSHSEQEISFSCTSSEAVSSQGAMVSLDSGSTAPGSEPVYSSKEICSKLDAFLEKRDVEAEKKLNDLFDAAQSNTARENLLLSLRHRLLVEIARQYGYTKVLVGDNATRLAVRLLGNIAQGRGASLPLDTGFADTRNQDVTIARPLREFPSREVAMYTALNNLNTVTLPAITILSSDKASLEQLTESFIAGLQADFPSTVSTIFRTGDKLKVSSVESSLAEQKQSCTLCQVPLDDFDDEAVFTHLKVPVDGTSSLWNNLCYGCRLTLRDMKGGASLLPSFAYPAKASPQPVKEDKDEEHRRVMKEQIKEYLLDDMS